MGCSVHDAVLKHWGGREKHKKVAPCSLPQNDDRVNASLRGKSVAPSVVFVCDVICTLCVWYMWGVSVHGVSAG